MTTVVSYFHVSHRVTPNPVESGKSVSKDRETVADAGLARLIVRSIFHDVVIGDT
jgi:hypothetical protein